MLSLDKVYECAFYKISQIRLQIVANLYSRTHLTDFMIDHKREISKGLQDYLDKHNIQNMS